MNTLAFVTEENDDQVVVAKPNQFAIEKGVPIPTWHNNNFGGYTGMFPFHEMKIGDSFLIPCTPTAQNSKRSTVINAQSWYKKKYNPKFKIATRKVTGGIRAWRVRCVNDK